MGSLAKIGRVIKDAWLMLGIALLLFCLLEAGASLALRIKHRIEGSSKPRPDWRSNADAYSDSDRSWVQAYYDEFRRSEAVRWRPYVYWRRRPYRGEYINVDTNGLRRTSGIAAQPHPGGAPIKIFMFGGSALWGTGARDDFTIPSLLARELQGEGVPCEIINLGESGYVSTQEVIALLLRLQKGDSPDVAVFYDGANDTFSAYQQRIAGIPQNEFNRAREFNLSSDVARRRAMTLRDMKTGLSTVGVLSALLQKAGVQSGWRSGAEPSVTSELASRSEPSGEAVVATYLGNMEIVKALSEHYHFQSLFYWQPTIFQKPNLTQYERGGRKDKEWLEPFFKETYAIVQRSRLTERTEHAFRDLSLVFAGMSEPVFVDWAHVAERGNELIAQQIARDVVGLMAAGRAGHGAAPVKGD